MVGVGTCFVMMAASRKCGREVDAQRCLSANEGWVEAVEGVGKKGGGVGIAETGECVAAPPGEVNKVKGHVGAFVGRFVW